jgi:hypothetical protein
MPALGTTLSLGDFHHTAEVWRGLVAMFDHEFSNVTKMAKNYLRSVAHSRVITKASAQIVTNARWHFKIGGLLGRQIFVTSEDSTHGFYKTGLLVEVQCFMYLSSLFSPGRREKVNLVGAPNARPETFLWSWPACIFYQFWIFHFCSLYSEKSLHIWFVTTSKTHLTFCQQICD